MQQVTELPPATSGRGFKISNMRPSAAGLLSRLACIRAISAGIDVAPLMVKAIVTRKQVEDQSVRLAVNGQIEFVELVADALHDDLLGFHLACGLEAMHSIHSGVLRVRTEFRNRKEIAVAVEDSGPGIDPEQLGRIFRAFVTTKTNGTGLGLAICRMIIEHHGGQLTASSDGVNGALFEFVLPIKTSD